MLCQDCGHFAKCPSCEGFMCPACGSDLPESVQILPEIAAGQSHQGARQARPRALALETVKNLVDDQFAHGRHYIKRAWIAGRPDRLSRRAIGSKSEVCYRRLPCPTGTESL